MKKAVLLLFLCVVIVLISCGGKTGEVSGSVTDFSGSYVEKGRPAGDLASYTIAYYEAAGGGAQTGGITESSAPLIITDYGPRDELPSEIKKPLIYVVFSQPIVPLAQLGNPIKDDAALFQIDPPITGVYRWYGSRLLSFESGAERLPQQRYTVTVSDKIQSLGGKKLQGQKSFSFETERLSVLEWRIGTGDYWIYNGNVHPGDGKYQRLIFSYPVDLQEIAKWIEVRAGSKTFTFTVERFSEIDEKRYSGDQGVLVSINEALPLDTDIEFIVKSGARSQAGWLGTKENTVYRFHTLLPFEYNRVSVRSHSSPRTEEGDSIPIALEFSQDVESSGAEKYFSVEGMPAIKKENIHVYGSTVVINRLPLEYQKSYRVHIAPGLKDVYGRSLGNDKTVTAHVDEANSYVYIHNKNSRMLEAGFPPMIVWEAQNPVRISKGLAGAQGPYERLSETMMEAVDVSALPKNSKRFFMEDLSPFLGPGGKGSAALRWQYETKSSWEKDRLIKGDSWLTVQVTDIGVTVRYAYNMVLVWATRLSTGEPIAGAQAELLEGRDSVTRALTDAHGLAVFEFDDGAFASRFTPPENISGQNSGGKGFRIRITEKGGAVSGGDSVEFMPNDSHNLWRFNIASSSTPFAVERERPVTFIFTDRGLYKPGETVTFRGIDRNLNRGRFEAYKGPYFIEVSSGSREAEVIASIKDTTTQNGGSSGSFTLPSGIDTGQYYIRYRRTDAAPGRQNNVYEKNISFTVANFERLRFEASLRFPDITFYQGEKLTASLGASYLAGGVLSGAPYTWYWTREPSGFNPGGLWRNWRFGPENYDGRNYLGQGEGSLGPDGKGDISTTASADGNEGAAYRYRLEASVQDAGRQEIAARAAALVHPASFYIAARLDAGNIKNAAAAGAHAKSRPFEAANPSAYFLSSGREAVLSWVLVAPDGGFWQGKAGDITIQLIHHDWKQARQAGVGGRINLVWERVEEIVEEKIVQPPSGGAAAGISGVFPFKPSASGLWEVRLRSRDQKDRIAATRWRFYVSGAGWVRWNSDDVDSITLTTDKPVYAPGETAKILVRSPLPGGKYLLTLEREGILSRRIIDLEGSALTIDIPIEESYVPIVYAALSSYTVRSGKPENSYYEPDLDKPKGVFGITPIYVDNETRHYQVEIEKGKGVYGPAEKAEVKVKVSLGGRSVAGAEVTFMAVDRGVLDLIDYHVPDPIAFFYNPVNFPLGVRGADSRSLLIDPVTYTLSDLQGGDDEDTSKLDERKDFRPTAVFEPYLVTGDDGTVTVNFDLPDSLTTYRCTALAVGLDDFGISEQDLKVSAPLTAVAALPRKLRWRDTGTVSLILTNLENNPVEANVSLFVESGGTDAVLEIDKSSGGKRSGGQGDNAEQTLKIPALSTVEAVFKVAAVGSGTGHLVFTLRSPKVNERILRDILVDRPALTETVTTIGNLGNEDSFIEEGIVFPALVPEGTGNLSVSLSASRLAMLKESVKYLLDYPYGCLEQRTARLLPLISFQEHLSAFALDTPVDDPGGIIEKEFADLVRFQLPDGSWPYWPGGQYGNLFVTLRVLHAAALAAQKGIELPLALNTGKALSWIESDKIAERIFRQDPFLKGYSLWVRSMYGEQIRSEISVFLQRGDELGISGWSFAGLAALDLGMKDLARSARDRVRRFIRPGTRSLDLTDTYERRGNFWGYDADRYALALMLYHGLNPEDDMTSRLANSLIERQRRGIWTNTASSFWAVLAFGRIAGREAEEGTKLSGSVSVGGLPFMDAEFSSYGLPPVSLVKTFDDAPVKDIQRDTLLPLRIERNGTGRLYYTASLQYGIPAELAGARDEGFSVFAETFDSAGNPVNSKTLIAGRTYTRRVTVSGSSDRTYVVLKAPVPSGAEIIDAAFVTSSTVPPGKNEERTGSDERVYWESWEEPPVRFIMDDEIRFHWDFFKAGKKEVEFRFRALMPGVYPTPPASAECMYENEIFGRAAGELIRIETPKDEK
jgi:uncharacterized protein YfaS (alpha-2-macroglobulin family)